MSQMRETMWLQPGELRRILADPEASDAAAERLRGRRIWLIGIGTSWHAAHHGAWLLGEAGVAAHAAHAADLAPYGWPVDSGDGVIALSHTGVTGYTAQMLDRARSADAAVAHVTAVGAGGDLETVPPETSYA